MGPQTAIPRRMRVTIFVCVLVMQAMCRDPEDWPTLQSQRATYG